MKYNSDYVEYFMRDIQKNTDEMYELRSKLLKKFQKSEFALLDSDRALFDWSCKQTYIALGNMLTSAAMIGIDSCPIEGFQKKELAKKPSVVMCYGICNYRGIPMSNRQF